MVTNPLRRRTACCALGLAALLAASLDAETLIDDGSIWRYDDSGEDLGVNWRSPEFDDSRWPQGIPQFGFGDGDESTVLLGFEAITFYYRHVFHVADPDAVSELLFQIVFDDGCLVTVNGVEVVRANLPDGEVTHETLALLPRGFEESFPVQFVAEPSMLVRGDNLIAVEVHQYNRGGEDTSFALRLDGLSTPLTRFRRGDANADGRVGVSDVVAVLLHLFRGGPVLPCEKAANANRDFQISIADAVDILLRLFPRSTPPPSAPGGCGLDDFSNDLSCDSYPACG